MTRDDVIRWAREAGFQTGVVHGADGNPVHPLVQPIGSGCVVELERFAALVAAAEREAIMDEWSTRLQSDLEHGVRWLSEKAAERWKAEYPQMAGFASAIDARSTP